MERGRIVEYARQVPIPTLLGLKVGRRQTIRCPFHEERTPSCVLYPDNSYYCFGCGANGQNSVDFLMGMGYKFSDCIEELLKYIK